MDNTEKMADSSDTGSVQSLQAETANDKKDAANRFYALYSFYANRVCKDEEAADEGSVKTSADAEDGTSSLSVAATNLSAATETDLRKSLSVRLNRQSRNAGEGKFCSMGLSFANETSTSASCYYCILESPFDNLGFDHVASDGKTAAPSDNNQFVLCFISFQESSLDPFRLELEQFTQGLMPLMDKELVLAGPTPPSGESDLATPSTSSSHSQQLTQVGSGISSYLEQWPSKVLGFLTRTLVCIGPHVQQLIHSALLNASLEIKGATADQEEDIRRFCRCCSLSPLLEQLQASDPTTSNTNSNSQGGGEGCDPWQVQPVIVSLTLAPGQNVTFDKTYSCTFCKNAADKLMSHDPNNVMKTRDFLESIKLAFIHNLNKLKRFLQQAEVDHYALYRALLFLRKCGCGDLLLRYVRLDAGPGTLSVLSVLETFVKEMKQTLS